MTTESPTANGMVMVPLEAKASLGERRERRDNGLARSTLMAANKKKEKWQS